jgi:molecular chaperone GrpE
VTEVANSHDEHRRSETDEAMADPELMGSAGDPPSAQEPAGNSTDNIESQLRHENSQLQDRVLRAQAELENYRRRAQRQLQDELRFANQPLLVDLLPVIDNIERAIEAAEQSTDGGGLLTGFKMVQQLLLATLERHHCTRVPAAGQNFDPSMHEALLQTPHPDVPAGQIAHVSQHGYQLHGRVIRPAQVVVSSGPASN